MTPKKQSELTRQLDDLAVIAGFGRRTEAHNTAPAFEANVARVRGLWTQLGVPALRELEIVTGQLSPDFDAAARIDFDGLRRAGCPGWRVEELKTCVAQARNFMSVALAQLSRIPAEIDAIQPQDEQPWIVNNKASQRIEYAMNGVLGAASDIRQRHARMKDQISQLSLWLPPSTLRPAGPAQGAENVN